MRRPRIGGDVGAGRHHLRGGDRLPLLDLHEGHDPLAEDLVLDADDGDHAGPVLELFMDMALHVLREDLVPLRLDDELGPAGEMEPLFVVITDIARVADAVLRDRLGRVFRITQVSQKDLGTGKADLPDLALRLFRPRILRRYLPAAH